MSEPRVLDERTHPSTPIALTVVEYPSGAVHIAVAYLAARDAHLTEGAPE